MGEPDRPLHSRLVHAALVGILVAIGGLLLWRCLIFLVLVRLGHAPRQPSCLSNLKELTLGLQMYAQDYDGEFPPAARWVSAAGSFRDDTRLLDCPQAGTPGGYAFNGAVAGVPFASSPDQDKTVALFDASCGRGGVGGPEIMAKRHKATFRAGFNAAFLDGHVKWSRDPAEWRWSPKARWRPSSPRPRTASGGGST